jgi:hypothetical protein
MLFRVSASAPFWPRSQLATRNYLLAAAAACEHVLRPRPRERVQYRRHGATGTGVVRVPGRAAWAVWPGAKSKLDSGQRRYFLCYVN